LLTTFSQFSIALFSLIPFVRLERARTWNSLPAEVTPFPANFQNQTKMSFILGVVSTVSKLFSVCKESEVLRHVFTLNLM